MTRIGKRAPIEQLLPGRPRKSWRAILCPPPAPSLAESLVPAQTPAGERRPTFYDCAFLVACTAKRNPALKIRPVGENGRLVSGAREQEKKDGGQRPLVAVREITWPGYLIGALFPLLTHGTTEEKKLGASKTETLSDNLLLGVCASITKWMRFIENE